MTLNEQQKEILQILYKRRLTPFQTLDRDDLAQQMGKQLREIQADVVALGEKGYVVITRSSMEGQIFYRLRITAEGVRFIEEFLDTQSKHDPKFVRKISVFISSPSDVGAERKIVTRVIADFNRMHSVKDRYVLQLLDYEQNVPSAMGRPPQDIVDSHMMKAGSSDLFICVFWHRMGTPVTHLVTGEHFQSGTEYEFVDAYRHNLAHGKPYIMLYRCMKRPYPPEAEQQADAVETFFQRVEGEHAEFQGLYKKYVSIEEFEDKLFYDIEAVLSKNLL